MTKDGRRDWKDDLVFLRDNYFSSEALDLRPMKLGFWQVSVFLFCYFLMGSYFAGI
jgi:hypothetical protein